MGSYSPITIGLAVGIPFGVALHKSRVSDPNVIAAQLQLRDFTMVKTFLSGVTSSLITVSAMESMGWISLAPKPFFPIATIAGGGFIGLGMHIIGACPGTAFAQIGSGRWQALHVISGGLLGALAFGYAHPYIIQHTNLFENGSIMTLHQYLGVPMWQLAIPILATLVSSLWIIERCSPTPLAKIVSRAEIRAQEAAQRRDTKDRSIVGYLKRSSWSPYVCGALIGALQVPAFLLAGTAIGTSSAFVTMAATVRKVFDSSPNYYFAKFALSPRNWFQLALDGGVVLGALASSWFSGERGSDRRAGLLLDHSGNRTIGSIGVTSKLWCVAGGALLVFGARLADGCTSGHGISGIAQLSVSSFVATTAMFAAGISAGLYL